MSPDDAPVLRAVEDPAATGVGAAGEPGLESLHAILEHVTAEHRIESVTIVVDDADLGRQAFRAGHGPHPALRLEPGVHLAGAEHDGVDAFALHALAAASLRAAVLDGVVSGTATPELELRRLGGVCLVEISAGDDPVVEIVATPDAESDIAQRAVETARHSLGPSVAIVVERLAEPVPSTPDRGTSEGGTAADQSPAAVELHMVHTTPETREIEVHIRCGDARSIGRAPMAGGLVAAVDATLSALHDLGVATRLEVGWARTVETTSEPSFVVTVSLNDADTGDPSFGAAAGTSPVDAAARASLLAASRAGT
jgi:hypothetical protein